MHLIRGKGKKNVFDVNFDMGLGFALAEVVHAYIAATKLPLDSIITINMTAVIDAGHYDTANGDAFGELFNAVEINLGLQ